jgi:hypothetical protein
MLLAEALIRKDHIAYKMEELKKSLFSHNIDKENRDEIVEHLFSLIDEYQKYAILVERVNNSTQIKVANSDVSLSTAVQIKETISKKMDVLTNIIDINSKDSNINYKVSDLMAQRDKLMEEYIMLSSAIFKCDWTTETNQ